MDKHTPGPWEWDDAVWDAYDPLQRAPWLVPSNNGKGFVLMGEIKCNSKSDALLIAAAPELLEALEGMLAESVYLSDEYLAIFKDWPSEKTISGWDKARWLRASEAVKKARAALSKARGEQV